jgi:hypothetical protein
MRPCQHCGRPIGVKEQRCPHCARDQSTTVGLAAPLREEEYDDSSEPDAAVDDDMIFYAAWRAAPLVVLGVGGFLGYLAAGVAGMMIGALVMALAAGVLLATVLGGPG